MLFAREGAKVLCADLNFEAASATAQAINDAAGEKLAIAVGVNVANAGTTNKHQQKQRTTA
jgi:NAD(P)-dependent dehydrogenase (short-subunit alcohol dehydrogenase family)